MRATTRLRACRHAVTSFGAPSGEHLINATANSAASSTLKPASERADRRGINRQGYPCTTPRRWPRLKRLEIDGIVRAESTGHSPASESFLLDLDTRATQIPRGHGLARSEAVLARRLPGGIEAHAESVGRR